MLDGSPLIDIKPYISKVDSREGTENGWIKNAAIGGNNE